MAASRVGKWFFNLAKPVNSHVTQQSSLLANQQNQLNHVRTKMVDFRMIRDNKRRKTVQEYGPERFRINMVRKSKIIPREIKEIADKEIREFPLNSAPVRLHNRCILTSRPRAVLKRWHISRIMFRSLADYNNLSGVTRSSW
ncbi:28S ribosomal protein S14, mitochondrial-like [Crassostrea angulata]|uniref:28S ribosomal protein S14, mitochondrial n=1 Tax=Magallana gigas TaxID=29159 RepID=A0A8W8N932_MAGGI|nr:28S ribosomal protein S14, mitochondrial [Crassostrea gigas]XP_052706567.1 28S ribosomal protein S14, mitochondrial-like [Crassostrea angulata]